uniref:vesicle-trafficking protein SEC22c isoform X1 n=1 Tax=Doryrhamphus excisus TaxID=161450 RepID=UPI0025AD9D83|nr:vesicle-trafficking protein SEC22c isoform X1 [Doryrhamphus excisus]
MMSLILFALVVRVRDGLPLSASTDFEHNRELQERKQQLRSISKMLAFFPERATIKGQELNIYLVSSEGVSYMSVCRCSIPVTTAFCFLEDLRWEFTACYEHTAVSLADRPYPFLHFDGTIQKLKQQYDQKGGPALEVTLAEVQEDLRLRPPQILTPEEVALTNGSANGHVAQGPGSGQNVKLEPVTAPGILSLVLNIMCASLNVIRGVHLMENTFQPVERGGLPPGVPLRHLPVSPVPLPFPPKDSQVRSSAERHRLMQRLPAGPEERLAGRVPRRRGLAVHRPHRQAQSPGQEQRLRGVTRTQVCSWLTSAPEMQLELKDSMDAILADLFHVQKEADRFLECTFGSVVFVPHTGSEHIASVGSSTSHRTAIYLWSYSQADQAHYGANR